MKLADKRSDIIKDLEDVADMSDTDIRLNYEYIRCVAEGAISFIKEQDAHIRTIRAQRDKARRELKRFEEVEGMKAVINNHIITEEEIAIEKLNRAMNDYLQDQETASQMEEAITYAVKILADIVEEGKE